MKHQQVDFFIHEYYERYCMLTDFPPEGLMREVTSDVNELINYVLAYVMNVDNDAVVPEIPKFLKNTMEYIVSYRASLGSTIDIDTMIELKKQVNLLVVDYVRELSVNVDWFNHHLKLVGANAGFGIDVVSPSLAITVEYGEPKMAEELPQEMQFQITPQVLTGIEMVVMRL